MTKSQYTLRTYLRMRQTLCPIATSLCEGIIMPIVCTGIFVQTNQGIELDRFNIEDDDFEVDYKLR